MNRIRIRSGDRRASWSRVAGAALIVMALAVPAIRLWAQTPNASARQDKPVPEDPEVKLGRQSRRRERQTCQAGDR